jgi:hypothetical protein
LIGCKIRQPLLAGEKSLIEDVPIFRHCRSHGSVPAQGNFDDMQERQLGFILVRHGLDGRDAGIANRRKIDGKQNVPEFSHWSGPQFTLI